MPPKKKEPKGPTAKTLQKEKGKVVEDKTFGLKNKNKSKTVQNYVKAVTNQVMFGGDVKGGARAMEAQKHAQKAEKTKTAAQKALLASLFKGVTQIAVNADGEVDHKKSLCAYFKAGVCEKGKKCKYSHDLALEDNRSMAIDLYSDPRVKIGKAPDTIITCKNFIDAVEKELYGFNWTCGNGGDDCTYRHMLPMGYVLKRDKAAMKGDGAESSEDEQTLEEKIEEERALLVSSECTPVTLETFTKWKADKALAKKQALEQRIAAEEAKGKSNKRDMNFISGRALFEINPDLFDDADDGVEDVNFEEDEETKAAQDGASDGENDNMRDGQENNEEQKEEVKVDNDLFADGAGAEDEDVDFD